MHWRMNVFLTEGKRVFHMSILSLVFSGNGYAYGRLSYGQASTYCPCHTYCVAVLVFVRPYVRTALAGDPTEALHGFQWNKQEINPLV